MVRTIITVVMLCLCAFGTGTAYAEETIVQDYPVSVLSEDEQLDLYALQEEAYQGTISSTYVTYFRDIAATLPVTHNYVMLRTSDDVYKMYSGDIEESGGDFNLYGDGYCYTITYEQGSGYGNSYYSYNVSPVSDVSITAGNKLVYSNLGGYPSLTARGDSIEYALFVAFFSFCIACVLHGVFQFLLRNSQYHN